MTDALIGATGFVGTNLLAQRPFGACYHSKNIAEAAGQEFELLVCCGMPAAKWLANQHPEDDRSTLDRLCGVLRRVRARRVIAISTTDVYPQPFDVDEDSPIDIDSLQPYGQHRLLLERFLTSQFAQVSIVRLPALFGQGLKKNAIYDLLHNHDVHKIAAAAVFQFYHLGHLWRDLQMALDAGLSLVNFATEPVSIRQVARDAFGLEFNNDPGGTPARYDMRCKHAKLYHGTGGYLYSRQQVLADLRQFVAQQRSARP